MKTALFALAFVLASSAHANEAQNFAQDFGLENLNTEQLDAIQQSISQLDAQPSEDGAMNPGDEVPAGELKILGRGFTNRKTGDSLALAYYNGPTINTTYGKMELKNRTRLRHVFFDGSTHKANYIGPDFLVGCNENVTEAGVKQELKNLNKEYKRFRREQNHNRNFFIVGGGGLALAPAIWFTGLTPALPIYAGALAVWTTISLIYDSNSTLFANSAGGSSTIFVNQNGWNWSSNPKSVSNRNFQLYLKFLNRY